MKRILTVLFFLLSSQLSALVYLQTTLQAAIREVKEEQDEDPCFRLVYSLQ